VVSEFWGELLGAPPRALDRAGWYRIGPLADGAPAITFQPVPGPKTGKSRAHLDVRVDDLDAAVDLVGRLGGSGPSQVHRYEEGTVAVMADPEGNEFCLVALVAGAALQ
jgi:predicted enzyme related to lactoylglutathione lyase